MTSYHTEKQTTLSNLFVSPAQNKAEFRISLGSIQGGSHAGRHTALKSKAQGFRETVLSMSESCWLFPAVAKSVCCSLIPHSLGIAK